MSRIMVALIRRDDSSSIVATLAKTLTIGPSEHSVGLAFHPIVLCAETPSLRTTGTADQGSQVSSCIKSCSAPPPIHRVQPYVAVSG